MAHLKIRTASGEIETIELSRDSPVTIGAHATNDFVIKDPGVSTMHCRISWNGSDFEIVSANPEGIDINGELVRHKVLEPDERIKVGRALMTYDDPEKAAELEREKSKRIDDGGGYLKPIETDIQTVRSREKKDDFFPDDNDDDSLLPGIDDDQEDPRQSNVDPEVLKRRAEREVRRQKRKERAAAKAAGASEALPEDPFSKLGSNTGSRDRSESRAARGSEKGPNTRHRARRPGQEDILASPMVLGLGGVVLLLMIVAGTYGFLILRNLADQQLQAADTQRNEGKYQQAVKLYSDFLVAYPKHRLTPKAKIALAETQIDALITGSSPKWADGLDRLKAYIDDSKRFDSDEDLTTRFAEISYKIADGAASDAGKSFQRELLVVSDDARGVWQRYAPEGEDTRQRLKRLDDLRRQSVASIIRQETLLTAFSAIDVSIGAKDTMEGFRIRRDLLARYPELEDQRDVSTRLTKLLEIEQTATTKDDTSNSSLNYDVKIANAIVSTLMSQSRSRSDRRSTGKVIIAYHKDILLGIDALTGDPVWRRPVGLDLPFFPLPLAGVRAGYLLVNTRNRDLELIEQSTGQLIWRQPLEEAVDDAPLVLDGQIYLTSRSARLYQIDAESGRLLESLQFSQRLKGPMCLLADREHFAVAGDAEVIYIVQRRPLAAVKAVYYGHAPGAMAGPFVAAGGNLLVFENTSPTRSRVTALDGRRLAQGLPMVGRLDLDGQMHDPALLRGNILFVTTRPEQLFAISVSDVTGQTALSRLAGYQLQTGQESELHLSAGPNNRVWVSGSQLQKYQLTTDSITVDEKTVPLGRTIQPLQSSSNDIYTSFLPVFQEGATTSQFDRDSLASEWKLDHAGRILAWTRDARDESSLIAVTEDGNIHRTSVDRLVGNRFQKTPASRINRPKGTTGAFSATQLGRGELAVWTLGQNPQLWLINSAGQPQKSIALPSVLEADPVRMGGLLLLPISGRIVVVDNNGVVQEEIVGQGSDVRFGGLHVVDEVHLLVVDEHGQLTALEMRREPKVSFVKKSTVTMDGFVSAEFLAEKAAVAVISLDGAVRIFDANNLQLIEEIRPQGGRAQRVVPTNGGFVLCSGENTVEFFEFVGSRPERRWLAHSNWKSFPVSCVSLGSELICLFPQGLITKHDRGSGKVNGYAFLAQILEGEPMWIGSMLIIPTLDGSLCLLNLQPQANVSLIGRTQ